MLFSTDKQTQEDLNIYGKQGTDSIFSLFNRTATLKGSQIMEEMFRYPLSDVDAINKRTELLKYLKDVKAKFPFRSELFDHVERYLTNTDVRSKLQADGISLVKRINDLIGADADYKLITSGIDAIIEITKELANLLHNMLSVAGCPFKEDSGTVLINDLLKKEPFCQMIQETAKRKLSSEKLATYDDQVRFILYDEIRILLNYIYRLDTYITVAKVAVDHNFVFPVAVAKEANLVQIEEFRHPQLNNAVTNSISIDGEHNVIFLTGANMAGKSTFMKSLGLAVYLAHMGFPVAAHRMRFSVMDGIYTTINLADNLDIGASHFYAEVLRLKKIANELANGRNIFVVFDELFRGTNVKDAYEATVAVTSAFAVKRNSMFVISTHIIEAGTILMERCRNISFKYLPTTMNGMLPIYTYTLETGITDDRHGMIIINNVGILRLLKQGVKSE